MRFLIMILVVLMSSCSNLQLSIDDEIDHSASEPSKSFCSSDWFNYVESQVDSSDSLGHGPDLGSYEWQSVIEFKLGLRDQPGVPNKNTPEWCHFIQSKLDGQRRLTSFSCQEKGLRPVENEICKNKETRQLNDQINSLLKTVLERLPDKGLSLKQEHRLWAKGRDECIHSKNLTSCLVQSYRYRIAELNAKYELIEGLGPIFYVCDGRPTDEIVVMFYPTEPPSLIAERAGQAVFMLLQKAASGSKYQSKEALFWEHKGKANVIWGDGGTEMICEKMH